MADKKGYPGINVLIEPASINGLSNETTACDREAMNMGMQAAIHAPQTSGSSADGAETFTSDHFALLMRVAKLVGTSAEFICIICELSATEVKLRTFHPLPENRFALELPNGDYTFVEKMWERGSEAGFRFSAPIDSDAFIFEASPYAKRQLRLRTRLAATMTVGETVCPIVIRDLSQEGAQVEADFPLAIYQSLRLEAEPFAAPLSAKVQWKSGLHYGVLFQRAFSLAELARIAWSLHDPANIDASRSKRFEVVGKPPSGPQ